MMRSDKPYCDDQAFLFDQYDRIDYLGGRQHESAFEFFNRSAWKSAGIARRELERWFARLPLVKRNDLRGKFRGDDRRHASALLELTTHEILRAVGKDIEIEPYLAGSHPDFSAVYGGKPFLAECTVAQERDVKFGVLQKERVVLDAIDSVTSDKFRIWVEPVTVGESQPPLSKLRTFLKEWLVTLVPGTLQVYTREASLLPSTEWRWKDWKLSFRAIPLINSVTTNHGIGIKMDHLRRVVDDSIIGRALKRKAEKYHRTELPYLIVVAQRESLGDSTVVLDALLGRQVWQVNDADTSIQSRRFDGFWGSPSQPRNRHVSAVLHKRTMRNAWSICGQGTAYDSDDLVPRAIPEWHMVHNPAAARPLPEGMFPFAVEYVWRSERLNQIKPTRTLNEILGLSDPWPGEEH